MPWYCLPHMRAASIMLQEVYGYVIKNCVIQYYVCDIRLALTVLGRAEAFPWSQLHA